MFIVNSYSLAVLFCFITMLCWGSWGNTQKLASKSWRYELFYWDYVLGMFVFALIMGLTMGSFGNEGRPFVEDLAQADAGKLWSAVLGGVIFNASNILLSASTSLAGLSVAFPLGVGLALVLGVIINYIAIPQGDPVTLFMGVALIVIAIVCNGVASARKSKTGEKSPDNRKGIVLAVVAGVMMSFFYRFVAAAMDLNNFEDPTPGMLTPYSALFMLAAGVLLSNLVFNTYVMKKPFTGAPVTYKEYFKGSFKTHLVGMLGGAVWCLGTAFSYIAAGKAGAAVSYALGQGAPMIAALWGVFIWKEFKGADIKIKSLLGVMFLFFLSGLALIVVAGNKNEAVAVVPAPRPIALIVETDMGNDIDDALAMDLIYKAVEDGQIELLAVGNHKKSDYATEYIDILNTWYGHPDTPLAKSPTPVFNDHAPDYTEAVCKMTSPDGTPAFARSKTPEEILDPVPLYRRILASREDNSVTFLSLGFGTELAKLLESPADEISPLTGRELVALKVGLLSIMAGSYGENRRAEYNVVNDIPAMRKIFAGWDTPIVQNPFELGKQVMYPGSAIENDFSRAELHPVAEGYRNYHEMPYDRASWDMLSVVYLTDPEMFTVSESGVVRVDDEGFTDFTPDEEGKHLWLSATPEQAAALLGHIVETTTRIQKDTTYDK